MIRFFICAVVFYAGYIVGQNNGSHEVLDRWEASTKRLQSAERELEAACFVGISR